MVRTHNISFFFSSGRRHTSWPRDWSSDVCSSDLGPICGKSAAASSRKTQMGSQFRGYPSCPPSTSMRQDKDMTYTLVLLRHGESDWNAKNLFTGWVDVHLSEKRSEEHTSELQSRGHLVCRLLL